MKVPPPPPASLATMALTLSPEQLEQVLSVDALDVAGPDAYHPWDWYQHHPAPPGLDTRTWWVIHRLQRQRNQRTTVFRTTDGLPFNYNLPDELLSAIDDISARARGQVMLPEAVATPRARDTYLVRSLEEEAITSSQLEGASTSRVRAKEMLREKRRPRDRSERMILNNFNAMQRIVELKDEELSPTLITEIHRIVTEGTLDDPTEAGRIQRPTEPRVRIYGDETDAQVLHIPPPAEELPERLDLLCDFANATSTGSGTYMPPLLRALTLHFMMGYDHYFADGNGRTSRAVFYWSMLHQGFFLTEFLSISRLLRRAPAQYARSFLLTEQDEGDLTHFFLHHARVLQRAIDDLETYLARKADELRHAATRLRGMGLNHRQVELIDALLRDPGASITVESHRMSHGVVPQTARTDLQDLERRGILQSVKQGRRVVWYGSPDFESRLEA